MATRILIIALLCQLAVLTTDAQAPFTTLKDIEIPCSIHYDSSIIILRNDSDLMEYIGRCNGWFDFDFSAFDIIGVSTTTGGCNTPEVEFEVIKNNEEEIYYINATIFVFGACRRVNFLKRFVIIEKMDVSYDVQLSIKKKYHRL